jgi:hypothetical protein
MERVERVWHRRLRWRLRGAWQWPSFVVLTVVDGVLLAELPFTDDGSTLVAGILIAGFMNLFVVAVLAPLAGSALRRRRPDLPRLIARDYAGTAALFAVTALLFAGGLVHRPALLGERVDERAAIAGVHEYVLGHAPAYRAGLAAIDVRRLEADLYRACVPGRGGRWLCLFVSTDQRPAGVTVDPNRVPNTNF